MSSLHRFLTDNSQVLLSHVPAVRDGAVEAIHDARVATRRIRAALDIINRHYSESTFQAAAALAKKAARALGRARDIDVSLNLLADLERRAPAAAPAAALCRRELLRERQLARRRLVKKFDGLPLDTLPRLVSAAVPRLDRVLQSGAHDRARSVADAIHHASGVYFPRRAHAARVEIKKLRYLLEFSGESDEGALKVLRKSQQLLGDIQDRQVLYETVEAMRDDAVASGADLEPLLALLEAECVVIYDRFLERRSEVLAVCQRLTSPVVARRSTAVTGLLTLGAVAAGSAWQLRRARAS